MPKAPGNLREFTALLKVVETLRGPDGCPWDKEQTHQSLTRFAIEEAHELAEAIDSNSREALIDELGDVLLQVVLHSEIARQDQRFSIEDVIENLNKKMIRRHPHVFADQRVADSAEVIKNWTKIKEQEKQQRVAENQAQAPESEPKTGSKSSDSDIHFNFPASLPALLKAQKIGEKSEKVNFDWPDAKSCFAKVLEELEELRHEFAKPDLARTKEELGDLFFSLVQFARHLKLDSEQVLRQSNTKFVNRFSKMMNSIRLENKKWEELTAKEKESFWNQAKKSRS